MPGPHEATPPSRFDALEQLGRLSLREHSMESLLQSVTELAKQALPGKPETSVSLLDRGRPSTAVFTGPLARDCDESQYGFGYGPCLHAAGIGELVEVADARVDTRWREYMRRAVEYGALGSLSVPLPITEGVAGALNIYVREPNAFDEESRSVATRFAPYAAVAVANMHAYQKSRDMAENLQSALDSRAVIDQAKGILMERYKLSPDQAFHALARASMQSNTKVRDIAEHLVLTGEFVHP
jgi:GAF domain-containing protein